MTVLERDEDGFPKLDRRERETKTVFQKASGERQPTAGNSESPITRMPCRQVEGSFVFLHDECGTFAKWAPKVVLGLSFLKIMALGLIFSCLNLTFLKVIWEIFFGI